MLTEKPQSKCGFCFVASLIREGEKRAGKPFFVDNKEADDFARMCLTHDHS